MTPLRGALLVLGAVALAWFALIVAWPPSVLTLSVDDAYYYLVIARHLCLGDGFTFDGLHPTNGFHPLWLAVLTPISALVTSSDSAMRVVLSLQVGLFAAGCRVLAGTAGLPSSRVVLAGVLVLVAFHSAKVVINGQESALVWLLACCLCWCAARPTTSSRDALVLGILGGALTLSRFTMVALAAPLIVTASTRAKAPRQLLLVSGATALMIVGTWLLWSHHFSGHVIPVSAAIKMRGAPGVRALVGGAVLASATLVWWRHRSSVVASVALASLVHVVGDGALRRVWLPEVWTMVPHVLLGVVLLARVQTPQFAGAAAIAVAVSIASWLVRVQPESWSNYSTARRAGEWLAANTPPETLAGSWDSGIVAAFSQRRVVNLDGLVNSWEFKTQVLDRPRALDEYLDRLGAAYLVQYFSVPWLRNAPSLDYRGASLDGWRVVAHECFTFQSSVYPRLREERVYVVLSRLATYRGLPTLGERRAALCAGAQ